MVLLRQFFREEIEIGLTSYLVKRLSQQIAERLVGKGEPTVKILAQHVDRQVFHEG